MSGAQVVLRRGLWALAVGLLLLLWAVPDLSSRVQVWRRAPLAIAPACAAALGPCAVRGAFLGPMSVRLDPPGVPANTPITVEFTAPPGAFSGGSIVWTGADMSMGRTELPLTEVAPGVLRATGPLPACVTGRMIWRLDLLLDGAEGPAALTLRLPSGAAPAPSPAAAG